MRYFKVELLTGYDAEQANISECRRNLWTKPLFNGNRAVLRQMDVDGLRRC